MGEAVQSEWLCCWTRRRRSRLQVGAELVRSSTTSLFPVKHNELVGLSLSTVNWAHTAVCVRRHPSVWAAELLLPVFVSSDW
jgi:hypothetical protein